jgi:hypothetical protein
VRLQGRKDLYLHIKNWISLILPSCPYNGYPGLFPWGKAAGAWRWPPTPSSAEVWKREKLYLHSLSGPSLHLRNWTLPVFHRVKVKRFPLQAWSGSWGSRRLRLLDRLDFRHYKGAKVVTLTHQPSLPPGVFLVIIFRGWVDPRAHGSVGSFGKNPQWHYWGSIPRPSD